MCTANTFWLLSMFDLDIMFLIVFSHMPNICHSSVNTAHDCSSTKGHGIGTQNYIQAIDAIVVHIVNLHFHEGDLVVNLVIYFPLLIDANLTLSLETSFSFIK